MKSSNRGLFFCLIAIVGLALLFFRELLIPGAIRFCTDNNIGQMALTKSRLPGAFLYAWNSFILVGMPDFVPTSLTYLLCWLLPLEFQINWTHAIFLGTASFFIVLYLRERGLRWPSCFIGALTAFWLASNFTLVYAGHISKFGILAFAAAYLWLADKAAARKESAWSILAGGALGATFMEQPDVAFFFALILGPYALFEVWRHNGKETGAWVRVLLPLFGVAFILALSPLWTGYRTAVRGVATMEEESHAEKWDYCTQWSWPPEESIDFIAPGYFGWRTGENAGPYWGRMGRSSQWETTGQGLRNFKLENQYIGAVPLVFACFALFMIFSGSGRGLKDKGGDWRAYVVFWGIAAVITLLLAFGKYFPLYSLFFRLPIVSSIRNPNKFLQIFQLAVAVLAAYGFDLAIGRTEPEPKSAKKQRASLPPGCSKGASGSAVDSAKDARAFLIGILIVAGLLALWSFFSIIGASGQIGRLAGEGWGRLATTIVQNRNRALVHALFMVFAAAALLWAFLSGSIRGGFFRNVLLWGTVLLVTGDALWLSRHYVHTMPASFVADNDIVRILKADREHRRGALITQEGFYNALLTYTFPYHGIETVNAAQIPRMPEDYKNFLGVLGQNSIRLWQLCAVGYVLSPAQIMPQIESDPSLKDAFELIYSFNMLPGKDGGMKIVPGMESRPGEHVVLRFKPDAPRYAMLAGWSVKDDGKALENLRSAHFPLFHKAMVAPESAAGLPEATSEGFIGAVSVREYRPGRITLNVSTDRPAILRIAEKYDEDWRATVNGRPTPVRRVDYIFQGVFVEPGLHEVVLRYRPPTWSLWVQAIGVLICVLSVAYLAWKNGFLRKSQ